jgi:hypothetical protein
MREKDEFEFLVLDEEIVTSYCFDSILNYIYGSSRASSKKKFKPSIFVIDILVE